MAEEATTELAELEHRFYDNPADIVALRDLSLQYYKRGMFNPRVQPTYEKARTAVPNDKRFAQALNITSFLKQLRRFTIESAEPELIDPDGLRDSISLIKDYLKELPNSPDLFVALGDLHMVKGNVLLAIGAYENALKFGYPDARVVLRSFEFARRVHKFQPSERAYFARLYYKTGLKEDALGLLREIVGEGFHDPEVVDTLLSLIDEAIQAEHNHNVQNTYQMEKAQVNLLRGDVDAALANFQQVRFPINQNFDLVKQIARILIERQDYRLAFDYLSKIPVDEENKQLINTIAAELEKIGELDTAVYLLKFVNENDIVIKEAQALREKEMEVHTELAVAELNFSSRRYDMAMQNYTTVLRLGYKDDAFVISRIIELLPLLKADHVDNLHVIGQYFLKKGDHYRASQFYDQILDRRQDDYVARLKLREIYDTILGRNPNLPELRLRSGDLFLQDNQLENAIAEYKHAAQFPETNIDATRRLAVAYIKTQNYPAALEAFQAIPINEYDLENLYQLHLALHTSKRIPEALSLLRMITEVDDSYRDVADRITLLRTEYAEEAQGISDDPRMRELIGDVAIGRYRYIEKIGSGGMGIVHKVFDAKLNTAVAMKILREGLANSNKAIERFFREARIAATLNHPNIVNIFDYNINNQTHQSYISMEFVDGPSLRDLFEQHFTPTAMRAGRDQIVQALYYMSQICDALEVTHSKGIIHRDIKPDNILVTAEHVAKITDFGIVHIEEATFTPTGALIGTPRYMAPEQVQGGKLDGRADLYSAGIILYEWLVGAPPFVSGDVAYQQVNINPTPPIDVNPGIPSYVNEIVLKALEKNPADRYQNARDLKVALDGALRKLAPDGAPYGKAKARRGGETDMDSIA
jgi:tetratricopeptide (TPR) repeat protein